MARGFGWPAWPLGSCLVALGVSPMAAPGQPVGGPVGSLEYTAGFEVERGNDVMIDQATGCF